MTAYMPAAKTDEWATPQKLFDELNDEFNFLVDGAASSWNFKAPIWYGLDHPNPRHQNGLGGAWASHGGTIWLNPPYGRVLQDWVSKAKLESKEQTVVTLLPARTDTKWFHQYLYPHCEIRFIKGRLKFGQATTAAPFPSMIVICRPTDHAL
jgi:phage N-6-adenine-methyltransferase